MDFLKKKIETVNTDLGIAVYVGLNIESTMDYVMEKNIKGLIISFSYLNRNHYSENSLILKILIPTFCSSGSVQSPITFNQV